MMKKTISAVIGEGDIFHNNRKIITENVNKDRINNNIILVQDNIKDVYHELFDDALAEYNARQTRKDRVIKNYHEHIRHSRQEKEFHEAIFQIGNRDDTHVGTPDADMCAEILKRFAEDFQQRNPHLRVFNAVIHLDEETPHLHIDFVPFATEQKRGLSTRVSLTKALEQQGFKGEGKFNTASKLWIDSEKQVLSEYMAERDIEWEILGTEKPHLSVLNYKKQERQKEIAQADARLAMRNNQIDSAESTLSYMQKKVDSKKAEIDSLNEQAKAIMNYVPDLDKSDELERKYDSISWELVEQLKSPFTIAKNKDAIKKNVDSLENITKKALNLQQKSEDTVYDLHIICDKVTAERDDAIRDRNEYRERCERAERENTKLNEKISYFQDLLQLLETLFPSVFTKIKAILQARYDREYEQEQQRNADRKKKYRDIDR